MKAESISGKLDQVIEQGEDLSMQSRTFDYPSVFKNFQAFEGSVEYPLSIQQALINLYKEYNNAFTKIVREHKEFENDYRFANLANDNLANNIAAQIDLQGLPTEFLKCSKDTSVAELTEVLRHRIFEIDNSIAMTNLLTRIGIVNDSNFFQSGWNLTLDQVREKHGKGIALLAVTDNKYSAILETELGQTTYTSVTDSMVKSYLGYDKFMSPSDLVAYFNSLNGRESDFLFFVRASDSIDTLKNPSNQVQTILDQHDLRKFIREYALTYNIDNPSVTHSRINDTKAYLGEIGMAYNIQNVSDLDSDDFKEFMLSRGIDTITPFKLRAKPYSGTYGCFGHVRGNYLSTKEFRKPLQTEINKRGPYVIQPELSQSRFHNIVDGTEYNYIHRVFIGTPDGRRFNFIGGVANCIESENSESKRGRIHGNSSAVWREIISE